MLVAHHNLSPYLLGDTKEQSRFLDPVSGVQPGSSLRPLPTVPILPRSPEVDMPPHVVSTARSGWAANKTRTQEGVRTMSASIPARERDSRYFGELLDQVLSGRLNRRQVMMRAAALGRV